jgi:hypothetical protein
MTAIMDVGTFKQTLVSLPLSKQRLVGAKFIANVLDLTDDPRLRNALKVASNPDVSPEELQLAYFSTHSVYVENHPRSDLAELDWKKQAAHFIAEALMVCLAPTYSEAQKHHLAEKVATYCQMARICSSVNHQGDYPSFAATDGAVKNEIQLQFRILTDFVTHI